MNENDLTRLRADMQRIDDGKPLEERPARVDAPSRDELAARRKAVPGVKYTVGERVKVIGPPGHPDLGRFGRVASIFSIGSGPQMSLRLEGNPVRWIHAAPDEVEAAPYVPKSKPPQPPSPDAKAPDRERYRAPKKAPTPPPPVKVTAPKWDGLCLAKLHGLDYAGQRCDICTKVEPKPTLSEAVERHEDLERVDFAGPSTSAPIVKPPAITPPSLLKPQPDASLLGVDVEDVEHTIRDLAREPLSRDPWLEGKVAEIVINAVGEAHAGHAIALEQRDTHALEHVERWLSIASLALDVQERAQRVRRGERDEAKR